MGWPCVWIFVIFISDGIKVVHISYNTVAMDTNMNMFLQANFSDMTFNSNNFIVGYF